MAIIANILAEFNPKGINDAETAFNRFGKVVGGALATTAIVNFGQAMVNAAVEDEASMKRLETQLRNTISATDDQVLAVEQFVEKTQNATGVLDDQLRPALGSLVRATGDAKQAQELLTLAIDISIGTGRDLEAVSLALAKAQDGNVGALGRLGIATKDAEGKTLSFEQIVGNLSKTFGGQADAALDTTEGKMRLLSVQFESAKEAIGQALIPGLTSIATAITPVVQAFGNLNPELRNAITTIGLSTALTKSLGGSLEGLGVSAGVAKTAMGVLNIAMIAYTVNASRNAEESQRAATALGDLSRASDEQLQEQLALVVATRIFAEESTDAKDVLAAIAQESLGTAQRLVDLGIAQDELGISTTDATTILNAEIAAQKQAQTDMAATTGVIEDQTEATDDLTDSYEEAEKKLQALISATLSMFSTQIGLEQSTWATQDAITAYNEIIGQVLSGTYEGTDAFRDYAEAENEVLLAALAQAEAAVKLATDTKEAAGASLSAGEAARIQREELEKVAATLDPGSPLRKQLDEYIRTLNEKIPRDIETKFVATISYDTAELNRFRTVTGRASGGSVTTTSPYVVGENGPELFVPYSDGTVVSNPDLLRMATSSSITGGGRSSGGTTVGQIVVNMPAGSSGDDVVRSLKRWVDKNGPIPIATTTSRRG